MKAAKALAFLSVASLGEVAARFQPFSDVEELKPHRLHEHCGTERFIGPDGQEHRKCQRHIKKTLDDDGELEFGWSMDADPDRILSLDTEAEHGVRMVNCFPDELELDLPESHIHHAREGQLVVASRFLHNCEHLGERHLFHRVKMVKSQNWRDVLPTSTRAATVRIMTEELPSLAHAVPSLNFHFKWMPYEALQDEEFPEMRTDFGVNRPHLDSEKAKNTENEAVEERKLFSFGEELKKLEGTSEDNGGFASKNQNRASVDNSEGVLNLMPKQLSNFGWNWDFFMNTTQQPNFEVEVPGARARWKIRKPYVKVHAGIYLNFSSQFGGLTEVPHVRWTWGINARGRVQGRFFGSMNTTSDAGTDPFVAFKLPVFQEFEEPMWFHKIDFATGELPITMEPGVQMTASMYHHGRFSGALGGGGKTSGWWNPALGYDSHKGLVVGWIGNLTDTTFWPPIWMIFTRAFEMGVIMKPTILMKGDFAGLERATMKIETRPYANVSIVRENADGTPAKLFNSADSQGGASAAENGKTLTVYPIRVIGLRDTDLNKKYKISVNLNGKVVETSPHPNWGTVRFRDHVTNFNMGPVEWKELTDPNSTKVVFSLIEVDESSGLNRTLGTGSAICASLVGDQCLPSPTVVNFMAGGQVVAQGSVVMLWSLEPEVWFPTMIEGLAFDLPSVIVREDTLAKANPDVDTEKQDVFAKVIQGGVQYVLPLKSDGQGGRKSEVGISIPPGFVDDWSPCASWSDGGACPRLELWAGSKKIGVANFPEIQFTSKTAMQGTASGSFLGKQGPKMNINSWIEMRAPGADELQPAIATMQLNTKVYSTLDSSMFLSPRSAMEVAAGSRQKVMWTVSNVDRSENYDFTLHALTMKGPSSNNWESYEQYRQVGSDVLVPVGTPERFSTRCSALTSSGLPSSSAPCVFSTTFSFEGSSFSRGSVVVLVVQWTGPDGTSQELTSPPISIGAAGNFGRRLGEDLTELYESQQLYKAPEEEPLLRRLWNKDVWNARTEQYSSCKDRNLRFNMGMGLLVRGKVDGLSVPDGFPMLGGTSSQPGMATDFKTIFAEEPGKEANEAFGGPDSLLCQAGLCEGALPGCTKVAEKGIYAPTLLLNFNRKYLFDKDAEGLTKMMRTALAYAFSTMPETVDLIVSELNKTAMERQAAKQASGTTAKPWYSQSPSPPSPTDWQPVQTTRSPFSPAPAPIPAPAPEGETVDAFNKWWSGADSQRRLAAASALSGRPREVIPTFEEIPDVLAPHQAKLHFKDGIDFVMNRALIQLMVQSGYLDSVMDDVEDGLYETEGPLRITSFSINSGVPPTEELFEADLAAPLQQFSAARTTNPAVLAVVGGLASFLLVAAVALFRRRSQQYHKIREGAADFE
mmetsp:Transcript_92468/g.193314  ORF Transcript_92468/g.193314 Transcript_92468/m.193314 type:complete len:1377 (+) Transcript_92468:93-4223(+)